MREKLDTGSVPGADWILESATGEDGDRSRVATLWEAWKELAVAF